MINSYSNFLFEYNLSSDNYDKYYYVVLRYNDSTMSSLLSKKLDGLKGISDSVYIINYFFDIRDILLVMNKDDVERINDLEKIKYDDIEYLTKDNFKILRRIYNVNDGYSISSLIYQGFRKLEYKIKNFKKLRNVVDGRLFELKNIIDRNIHIIDDSKITNYSDLLNEIYSLIQNKLNTSYNLNDFDTVLKLVILNFSALFKKEGEVIVNNQTFNIPDNSFLFIKEPNVNSTVDNQVFLKLKKEYLSSLNKMYYVKILPYIPSSNGIISDTHKQVFVYLRYLDKLKKVNT